ncbi:MAG: Ig-like domain-containing protein [Muribaculaceae bacterium]|nr:Ig-like domain-containing protein [Muribaculaceae bacterium]
MTRKNGICGLVAVLFTLMMAWMASSCASIGSPEGGPRDYTPPRVVRCSPAPGTLNFKGRKVEITFDEYIQLKDQSTKVVISPAPKDHPSIKALGRKVSVEFQDELLPNTTYVIDFTNALSDNNESNPLDGFSFAFSTGENLDTLQASGIVLRARDLEPMQHVLVGLHVCPDDSAFLNQPFDRITRTNDKGEFTLRNLAPGDYRIYALNDLDGNYRWARNEDMAWTPHIVTPSTSTFTSQDTVFTFDHRVDTVTTGTHTQFLPNDVYLPMFNENYRALYLKKTERVDDNKLSVILAAPAPEEPRIELLRPRPQRSDWCSVERRSTRDSVVYWLTDSILIKADSITARVHYLKSDSLDNLVEQVDTVHFVYRKSNAQIKAEAKEKKNRENREKEIVKLQERLNKLIAEGKETEETREQLRLLQRADSVPPPVLPLNVSKGKLNIGDSIAIACETPISRIDRRAITLRQMQPDSTWTPIALPVPIQSDTCSRLRYVIPAALEPGGIYRLRLEPGAVTSVYDIPCDSIVADITVGATDEYSNLYLTITPRLDEPAFVELIDAAEKITATVSVKNGEAEFENVEPGYYFARITLDANGNGQWDTGNFAEHRQPETVLYYPGKLRLRANWDVEQAWDIFATPLNLQKPDDIKHNQPEQGKSLYEQRQNKDKSKRKSQESEEDEFNSNSFGDGIYSGNKYRDNRTGVR